MPAAWPLCGYVERQYKFAFMFWTEVVPASGGKNVTFTAHPIKAAHHLVVFKNVNGF